MSLAIVETVVKLLQGIGLLKDPAAEAAARKALNETLTAFYSSTSGGLYQAARFMLFLGSMWDIFANQSRAWVAAVANMQTMGMAGFFELVPIAWLYFGPETWAVIKEIAVAKRMQAEGSLERARADSRVEEPARPERGRDR